MNSFKEWYSEHSETIKDQYLEDKGLEQDFQRYAELAYANTMRSD